MSQIHDHRAMAKLECFHWNKVALKQDREELCQIKNNIWKWELTLAGCAHHMVGAWILQKIEVVNSSKLHLLMQEYKHHWGPWSWKGGNVTFLLFALLHADALDCSLSSIPPPSIGLLYFIWFDLASVIPSCHLMACMISIWCCDMISSILLYDIHLSATHMTTSSIKGVQIPISLVNSATNSLCWVQQYLTCNSIRLRP